MKNSKMNNKNKSIKYYLKLNHKRNNTCAET